MVKLTTTTNNIIIIIPDITCPIEAEKLSDSFIVHTNFSLPTNQQESLQQFKDV